VLRYSRYKNCTIRWISTHFNFPPLHHLLLLHHHFIFPILASERDRAANQRRHVLSNNAVFGWVSMLELESKLPMRPFTAAAWHGGGVVDMDQAFY
jgi:hypothetical protein